MPQRFLRPGIRTSGVWNQTSFGAQSLYLSILTLVDDFGRYDGRAQLLHGECFSLRNDIKPHQTAALLQELHDVGLIQLYTHEQKEYLQVLRWYERTRSATSKFPTPQESAAERSIPQGKDASLVLSLRPKSSSSPASKRHSPNGSVEPSAPQSESEWITELQESKPYKKINVANEYGKMLNWCKVNHKNPTRRRFINWLNRADSPMSGVSVSTGRFKSAPVLPLPVDNRSEEEVARTAQAVKQRAEEFRKQLK